jgi:ribose transport system ATP-binding protein
MFFLEAKSLKKNFGGIEALKDGTIRVKQGKICGLLGANGSGKTTLSRLLTGIYRLSAGSIKLDGKEEDIKNPSVAQKLGIVMVHQNLSLLDELTVWENIALGHEESDKTGFVNRKECIAMAKAALGKLTEDISVFAQVKNLSPAEKQLVEIAKALSKDARLLILDEPTAALTKNEVDKLFAVMRSLKEQGITMIFISHRLWEVMNICDQVVVLRNGATVGEIDFDYEEKNEKRIVSMITGKKDENICDYKTDGCATCELVLETKALCASGRLENISLQLRKGEILGVAGLQGQGQEQLLEVLSGMSHFDKGTILHEGKPLRAGHSKRFIRKGIVLVPGDRHKEGLFLSHTIYENIIFPQFARKRSPLFLDKKRLQDEVQAAIDRLNIVPDDPKKEVKLLSGGNQQKVVVGKWLSLEPNVLLLSDPAKGVDVEAKAELYRLVCALAAGGASVVLYASDNEELLSICDRFLIMFEGRVVQQMDNNNMTDEMLTEAVFNASRIAAGKGCANEKHVG